MKHVIFLFILLVVASCSSVQVSSDYDRTADFPKYKTYAFTEESLKLPIGQLDQDRMISAVEAELAAKGFTKSENPDMMVDLLVKIQHRTEATATNTGGYYGRYGRYGYAGGMSTTSINYEEYTDGTLIITFIDNAAQKIFWQGRGTKTIDENANASKRESSINYAVKSIIAKYPPQIK
jgi:Domain of unknown function (DUF4136)